ncbi:uncharacterized protein [Ptychodera flava]|uniref:uncharacterized protein n=1 Tax=Ptychodera flava TaxID=63121 RepID=UPI00396A4692
MAKARVAPTSDLSLPRLELMAALIGTRLSKFVINALSGKINITQRYLWSDSQIALYWINSVKKLPIFVSNRVREINGFRHIYKYCPSADNPADLLTRGITSDQLANSTLWWNGPTWLKENGDWPICELFDSAVHHIATTDDFMIEPHTQIDAEVANKMQHVEDLSRRSTENIGSSNTEIDPAIDVGIQYAVDITRFSSLDKLFRVTSYVFRFKSRLQRKRDTPSGAVSPDEIRHAEQIWIKDVQSEIYTDTIHSMRMNVKRFGPLVQQLNLFLDNEGTLRCGSRVHNAALDYVTKFPALLPPHHEFTKLVVLKAHERVFHGGVQSTVTQIRQQYWIPKIRRIVSKILHNCVTCLKVEGKPYTNPVQAPLPAYRVNITPPFSVTGVDFTGALLTKAYVCLFTCAVTRAIHLELVPDLTTKTFLLAFRRFAARRSLPSRMLSDNASTYISGAEEIRSLLDTPDVRDYLSSQRVKWTFIPKRAPCADDDVSLTPNHLLHGRSLTSLPYITVSDEEIEDPTFGNHNDVNRRYAHLSNLQQQFWKRWSTEYLTALRERHSGSGNKHNVIKVGDVVLIHSDIDRRMKWQLGTVKRLVYGRDKLVRSAEISTARGHTNRPIHKLYPLEVASQELSSSEDKDVNEREDIHRQEISAEKTNDPPESGRPSRDAAIAARMRISELS